MLRQVDWRSGTARLPLDRASCDKAAKTQEKFYHTASEIFACPTEPARLGQFSCESACQSPVSGQGQPPAPETLKTDSALLPAEHVRALQPLDRWARQRASGP